MQKRRSVFTRDTHSHLLVERSEVTKEGGLRVCGYVRGRPLDVNSVIYVPDRGEFLLEAIHGPPDPCLLRASTSMHVVSVLIILTQCDTV